MTLLDDGAWQGKVWTGEWSDGGGGSYPAVEPATGETLGQVGKATPADVSAAAARAVEAQRAWAATPFGERARVLRRAGEVLEANGEEIKGWLAQESGAIQPFGDFQVHTSAQECYEASALPSHPLISSAFASSTSPARRSTRARSSNGSAAQDLWASTARTAAECTSSGVAFPTGAITSPVAGSTAS